MGGPPFLIGKVPLTGQGRASLRLRPMLILETPEGDRVFEGPILAFWPSRQRHARVKIEVDSGLAPGYYRGMLRLGDVEVAAEIYVTETVAMTVSPAMVFVTNQPNTPQPRNLVLRNTGNVALSVGRIGPVPLYGTPPPGTKSDEQAEPGGSLEFEVRGAERLSIAAGETTVVPCQITVSEGLSDGDQYSGTAPLWNARIEFKVIPAGGRKRVATGRQTPENHPRRKRGRRKCRHHQAGREGGGLRPNARRIHGPLTTARRRSPAEEVKPCN